MATQIFIWNIIILVLSIIFIIWVYKMIDNIADYDFYDAIVKINNCFIVVSILFSIMVYRTIKYTTVIIDNVSSDNYSSIDVLNLIFSFVPFVVNVVSFIMVVYLIVGVYKDYYFDKGTRYSTLCSFKTLKIINRFSNLETRYTDFYYIDKNGNETLLRFNFPVFLSIATTDGSFNIIPFPFKVTSIFAVPKSIPISFEPKSNSFMFFPFLSFLQVYL